MKQEKTPWSEALVVICTKCHKSISPKLLQEEGNAAENLKGFLKKAFKDTGDLGKIRIVTSSCLDVCEDDFQALSYLGSDGKTETFILNPETDRQEVLNYLRGKIAT